MKRYLPALAFAILTIVLLGLAAVMVFGTPQAPTSPAGSTALSPAGSGEGAVSGRPPMAGGSAVATGDVPPPDPSSPLSIEIPGCVCHSDDPALVEQHAEYRMNQCFGCHTGDTPQ